MFSKYQQNMRFRMRKQRGITMLEFALAAPVLILVILFTIDVFTYLYLANILEARAHRALETASWVPHLSEKSEQIGDGGASTVNADFAQAKEEIVQAALQGEISSMFAISDGQNRRAKLKSGDIAVIETTLPEDAEQSSDYFAESADSKIAILLPSVDQGTGSRDVGFARQPIGVRINAEYTPLMSFLPPISLSAEAWGFRENFSSAGQVPMFDCLGRPFNPANLPSPEDCNCGNLGMNPLTGQCGCPEGKVWGKKPGSTVDECICDVSLLNCHPGQLYDYTNCRCGNYCTGGASPLIGQRRTEDNTCGCPTVWSELKNESPGCRKNVCAVVDGVEVCKDETWACSSANCFNRTHFSSSACGCYCTRLNSIITLAQNQPNDGTTLYQYIRTGGHWGNTFTDPDLACEPPVCDNSQVPPGFIKDGIYCTCRRIDGTPIPFFNENNYQFKAGSADCSYQCQGTTWHGRHAPDADGKCGCKNGYLPAKNVYASNLEVDCCPATTCQNYPNTEVYVGNGPSNTRACLCRCKSGYIKDANTGECIDSTTSKQEGINN